METLTGEQLVSKVVALQAAANALGWAVTAISVPPAHAEAMVKFFEPTSEPFLRSGMAAVAVGGTAVSVGDL